MTTRTCVVLAAVAHQNRVLAGRVRRPGGYLAWSRETWGLDLIIDPDLGDRLGAEMADRLEAMADQCDARSRHLRRAPRRTSR